MIKKSTRKLPIAKIVVVDVDGTLVTKGIINFELIEWCKARKNEGFELVLWSSRGRRYAEKMARYADVTDIFDSIIGKPGYIVDDKGWSWTKYTRRVTEWQKRN